MATVEGKLALLTDILDHPEAPIDQKLALLEGLLTLLATPLVLSVKTYAADAVMDHTKTVHLIGSGVDLTGCDPAYVGEVCIIICTNSDTNATADCTSATWEGTNDLATFPDAYDALFCVAISTTRWFIVANIGGVTFS